MSDQKPDDKTDREILRESLVKDFAALHPADLATAKSALEQVDTERTDAATKDQREFERRISSCSNYEFQHFATWGRWPNE